jgi:tetratricopeptide (TPR) repeat protein
MNQQRCGGLILSLLGICLSVEMGSVIAQESNRTSINTSTSVSKCNNNIQPVGVDFNREIERQPNFAKAYNDRGEANLRLGNCNKAMEDFDRAIELLADYSKALVNRGNAKSLLGKYDEAISDFNRVSDNGDAIAGKAVAKILLKKREIRESLLASKKKSTSTEDRQEVSENQTQSFSCYGYEELKIEQKDVNTRRRFFDDCAMRYYREQRQEPVEIINGLNEAIRLQTTNPRAYYYRGMFRLAMENYPGYPAQTEGIESGFVDKSKALQDFNKSVELYPNYIDAYIERARLSFRRLKFADAVSNYDRAILAEPDNSSLYEERGDNKICQGLTSQAMADFDKAIQLDPNSAYAYAQRGFTKLVAGNKSGAIADYNIAFDFGKLASRGFIDPHEARKLIAAQNYSALYLQALYSLYYEFGVPDEDTFYQATQAILANPDRPYAYYFRYEVRKKYDPEGAKQDLQRAKELILTHKDSLDREGLDISDEFRAQFSSTPYISRLREMRVELTRSPAAVGDNKRVKPSSRRKK